MSSTSTKLGDAWPCPRPDGWLPRAPRIRVAAAAMALYLGWAGGLLGGVAHAEQAGPAPVPDAPSVQGATVPPAATAEEIAALRQQIATLREEYEHRLTALEQRLTQLAGGAPPAAAGVVPPAPPASPAPPVPSGAAEASLPAAPSQTSNYFNPSVSVIGNFLGVGGHNQVSTLPSAALRESELGVQAIVDPYARADFFLSFGEHGVDVEEGFMTFTSLPAQLLARVGRMRVSFGGINSLHLHVLPWPDEPLTQVNLLGGEEGWIGTGVSVARLLALPGDTFSELTVQVFGGDSANLFSAPRRGDLSYNGHYRLFRDLTEALNLNLGLSYAYGPNGTTATAKTRLEGVDVTVRYKPLVTGLYHSLTLRGEVMRSDRQQPGGEQRALGWFAAADYQLNRRWFVGGRLEAADRAADARHTDRGQALVVTFWPSEFSQLRAELRRRHYSPEEQTALEALFQLQFAIGAHGAHPF
jgi:hypothetical protein